MEPNKIPLNLTILRRKTPLAPESQISSSPSQSESQSHYSDRLRSSYDTDKNDITQDDLPSSEYQKNGDRDRIREKFMALFTEDDLGAKIEECLYRQVIRETGRDFPNEYFKQEYLGSAHNLLENLDPQGSVGNKYLYPLVIAGSIRPESLVKLSDHDLYPPKWQEIKERRLKEITTENEMQQATSDLYKCGKCGKRETTFYQLQTRSMDEPTTSFINCVNCGHRWKD